MSKEKGFPEIGKRLLSVRGDLDQRSFSRRVNVSQQAISNYERGSLPASWAFLRRLNEDFNVDLNWLLIGEGQREKGAATARLPLVDNRPPGWAEEFLQQPVFEAADPLQLLLELYFLYLATEPADTKAQLIRDFQKVAEAARPKLERNAASDAGKQLTLTVVDALERDDRRAGVSGLIALADCLDGLETTALLPRVHGICLAALTLARREGWREEELEALRRMGRAYRKEGRWEEAERFYDAAVAVWGGNGDTGHAADAAALGEPGIPPALIARTLLGYGHVAKHRGDIARARDRYLAALEAALQTRDAGLRAEVYLDLTCLAIHEREWEKGLEFVRTGSSFADQTGDRDVIVLFRINEALIARKLGDLARAESVLRPLLTDPSAAGSRFSRAVVALNLAHVLAEKGDLREAEDLLAETRMDAEGHIDPRHRALRMLLEARLESAKGEDAAARGRLVDCMRYAKERGLAKEFERAAAALDDAGTSVRLAPGSRAG